MPGWMIQRYLISEAKKNCEQEQINKNKGATILSRTLLINLKGKVVCNGKHYRERGIKILNFQTTWDTW